MSKTINTVQLSIVSAEEEIFSGEVNFLAVTGQLGELGIAPGHAPLLTRLRPGQIRFTKDGQEQLFYVSGGFLEVQPKKVIILADTAVHADTLNEAEILAAKKRAEQLLAEQKGSMDYSRAAAELAQAAAQIHLIQKLRNKRGA